MAVPIDTSVAHDEDTKASTAVKWITVDIFNKNCLTDFNIPLLSSAVQISTLPPVFLATTVLEIFMRMFLWSMLCLGQTFKDEVPCSLKAPPPPGITPAPV